MVTVGIFVGTFVGLGAITTELVVRSFTDEEIEGLVATDVNTCSSEDKDGALEGLFVGDKVDMLVEFFVGDGVGIAVGIVVGLFVGDDVGSLVGLFVGNDVGTSVVTSGSSGGESVTKKVYSELYHRLPSSPFIATTVVLTSISPASSKCSSPLTDCLFSRFLCPAAIVLIGH